MARREEPGLSLEAPADWTDRTLITYTAPAAPGETTTPTLVVARDVIKESETLQTYTDRHLLQLASELPDFELFNSGNRTIGEGNYPAIYLRFRWRPPAGIIEQTTVLAETLGTAGREVRVFSTTTLSDNIDRDGPRFEAVLKTVRLVTGKAPPGGSGGPPTSRQPPTRDEPLGEIPMPGYPKR